MPPGVYRAAHVLPLLKPGQRGLFCTFGSTRLRREYCESLVYRLLKHRAILTVFATPRQTILAGYKVGELLFSKLTSSL